MTRAIYQEADDSLKVLDDLIEQGVIPEIEASDFRASLERIKSLAAQSAIFLTEEPAS